MNKEDFQNLESLNISGEAILGKIRTVNKELADLLEKLYKLIYSSENLVENYQKFTELWGSLNQNTQREIREKSLAFHYLSGSSVPREFVEKYKGEPEAMKQFIEKLKEIFGIS